jgi:TatA/E family protein of Tat protein translocase
MGNLGMPELIFIFALALLILGPKKLPELGKQLGRGLGEFKRASNDLKRSIEEEVEKAARDEEATKPAEGPRAVPAEGTVASAPAEERSDPARPA